MTKVVLDDVGYVPTSAATINNNNTLIEQAVENTLSRDGTGPNEMNANLDMNSNRIINLPYPNTPLEPMRKTDVALLLEEMKDEFEGPQGPPGQDAYIDFADQIEAEAGSSSEKVMSPLRTKESIIVNTRYGEVNQLGNNVTTRTIEDKQRDTLSLLDFENVDRTGATSSHLGFRSAILESMSSGRKLIVPGGFYLLSNVVSISATKDIDIEFADNAIVVATSDLNNRIFFFAASGVDCRLRVVGGYFDASVKVGESDKSDDTFYVTGNWKSVRFRDCEFYHGVDYTTTPNLGSSAIFLTSIGASITGCKFTGTSDVAIYASGPGGGTLRSRAVRVTDCEFYRCSAGIGDKREGRFLIAKGNYFEECATGVFTGVAGTSPVLLPGRQVNISFNTFYRCIAAINVTCSGYSNVHGNLIQDHGYLIDGVTTQTNATAIVVRGSIGCNVSGNTIFMKELAAFASQRAVWVMPTTINGVTYNSQRNLFSSNTIQGVRAGFDEVDSSQDLNVYDGNNVSVTASPYILMGPDSILKSINTTAGQCGFEFDMSAISLGGRRGSESVRVIKTASSVNFIQMFGSVTEGGGGGGGPGPQIQFQGSDTNVSGSISTKGLGNLYLGGVGLAATLRLAKVASQVNYLMITAAIAGNPVIIGSAGADASSDISLQPKGPDGRIRFGTFTSSSDVAIVGSLEVKDTSGTLRKLAIIS